MKKLITVKPVETEKVSRDPLTLDFVSLAERCTSRRPKDQIYPFTYFGAFLLDDVPLRNAPTA
jgi:hypothetical protein